MSDKIINQGYEIEQEIHICDSVIVLGHNPELEEQNITTPFATWETDKEKKNFFWGHYFKDRYSAERDLLKRGIEKAHFYDFIQGRSKDASERDIR